MAEELRIDIILRALGLGDTEAAAAEIKRLGLSAQGAAQLLKQLGLSESQVAAIVGRLSATTSKTSSGLDEMTRSMAYGTVRAGAFGAQLGPLGYVMGRLGMVSEALAPMLAAVFPIAIVALSADLISNWADKIEQSHMKLEESEVSAEKMALSVTDLANATELSNLKLQDQIDKLEGRPSPNGIAEALLEADDEANKLIADLANVGIQSSKVIEQVIPGRFAALGKTLLSSVADIGEGLPGLVNLGTTALAPEKQRAGLIEIQRLLVHESLSAETTAEKLETSGARGTAAFNEQQAALGKIASDYNGLSARIADLAHEYGLTEEQQYAVTQAEIAYRQASRAAIQQAIHGQLEVHLARDRNAKEQQRAAEQEARRRQQAARKQLQAQEEIQRFESAGQQMIADHFKAQEEQSVRRDNAQFRINSGIQEEAERRAKAEALARLELDHETQLAEIKRSTAGQETAARQRIETPTTDVRARARQESELADAGLQIEKTAAAQKEQADENYWAQKMARDGDSQAQIYAKLEELHAVYLARVAEMDNRAEAENERRDKERLARIRSEQDRETAEIQRALQSRRAAYRFFEAQVNSLILRSVEAEIAAATKKKEIDLAAGENWLAMEMAKYTKKVFLAALDLVLHRTTETQKLATTASVGTAEIATVKAQGISKVTTSAGVAAAAQFADVMQVVPFPLNLGMAPAMAAAAFSQAMAFGAFERGGVVNQTTFAMLHPKEMVLPAHISSAVQSMAAAPAASRAGDFHMHLNYSPVIHGGNSISRGDLSDHAREVSAIVQRSMRRGMLSMHEGGLGR